MRIEIVYNTNDQLWKMESIAANHGYRKTEECYWTQIFTNDAGDHIITTREDGELSHDPVNRLTAILTDGAELVLVDDLRRDLDTGDAGEYLNDYRNTSTYICDAIAEIADNNTSIYYSDILDFIREKPEALAEAIEEGFYDPTRNYNLFQHGQAAEYLTIERSLYDHLADALMLTALDFIQYDLHLDAIPEELGDWLRTWCDDADNNDRMSDIPDRIREYLGREGVADV